MSQDTTEAEAMQKRSFSHQIVEVVPISRIAKTDLKPLQIFGTIGCFDILPPAAPGSSDFKAAILSLRLESDLCSHCTV